MSNIANASFNIGTTYILELHDKHGNLKWREEFHNLVTTEGLNTILDRCFKNVPANVLWYVGLKATGTPVAGDTMASHGSWTEITTYDEANRPALTLGTIASGSVNNSAAKAQFTISGTVTIFGAFLSSNNTKGGTTGALYSVGDFGASRAAVDDDVLSVQVTISAASA